MSAERRDGDTRVIKKQWNTYRIFHCFYLCCFQIKLATVFNQCSTSSSLYWPHYLVYICRNLSVGPDIFTINELFICGIVACFNPHHLAVQSYHAYLSRMRGPCGNKPAEHSSVRWMTILWKTAGPRKTIAGHTNSRVPFLIFLVKCKA